ncbi:NAD(P)-dependent oxidoreductase [Neobacillus niacini]|uniref:NAD(P)-dependent oxidoreductase n=1 Tax=Neobacillus niacini TaxID=86668 RepID=UPI0005EDCE5E|nr:NAD(P)-dependent oxidoreductase [Neobacillus niacini]
MKVGLIGLGNMGGRIAKRLLQEGNRISIYDKNPQIIQEFVAYGAEAATNPQALAAKNEIIITVLPNAEIVKEVVLGNEGLIKGFKPGSTLIEMTTSLPEVTRDIGKVLYENGISIIDAPISGGVKKAETGELSIMVGGEEAVFSRVLPILNQIGTTIILVGELGAGHTIKAINNLLCATTLGITAEALALGVKMGLDPEKMLKVINNSSGRSHSSEVKFPQQVLNRKFEVGFTIDLMYKDISIALSLAQDQDLPLGISEAVLQLWKKGVTYGGDLDHTAIAKVVEQMAGVEIKSTEKIGTDEEISQFIDLQGQRK